MKKLELHQIQIHPYFSIFFHPWKKIHSSWWFEPTEIPTAGSPLPGTWLGGSLQTPTTSSTGWPRGSQAQAPPVFSAENIGRSTGWTKKNPQNPGEVYSFWLCISKTRADPLARAKLAGEVSKMMLELSWTHKKLSRGWMELSKNGKWMGFKPWDDTLTPQSWGVAWIDGFSIFTTHRCPSSVAFPVQIKRHQSKAHPRCMDSASNGAAVWRSGAPRAYVAVCTYELLYAELLCTHTCTMCIYDIKTIIIITVIIMIMMMMIIIRRIRIRPLRQRHRSVDSMAGSSLSVTG